MSQDGSAPLIADGTVNPAPIICPYVTTVQIDSDLGDFINNFNNSGVVANYGALLIESLPESRPRPLGLYRISRAEAWPVSIMTGTPKIEGLYVLQNQDLKIADWPQQVEMASKTLAATQMDLPQFLEKLKSATPLGPQVSHVPAIYGGTNIRVPLGIKLFPTRNGAILRAVSPIGTRDLLGGNFITISTSGSAHCVQKSVAKLTTIMYAHRGAPTLWIVVPPRDCEMLEMLVRELFKDELGLDVHGERDGKRLCSQFMKHLNLWITPERLCFWGVRFSQVLLKEKQLMVLFPGSYYWGVSYGFNILETKAIAGPKWTVDGYQFCEGTYGLCKPKVVFVILQKAIDDAVAAEAAKKAKQDEDKKRRVKRGKTMHREDDGTVSTPSTPGGSCYDGDESFNALSDADYKPLFPNLLSKVPYNSPYSPIPPSTNNDLLPSADALASTSTTEPKSPPLSTLTINDHGPPSLEQVQAANAFLRTQNARLLALRVRYELQLQKQRAYYRVLEQELEKKEPDVGLWKNAALKAYGMIEARDARIEVLEEALKGKEVAGRDGSSDDASGDVVGEAEGVKGDTGAGEGERDVGGEGWVGEVKEGDAVMTEERTRGLHVDDVFPSPWDGGVVLEDVEMGL